MDIANKKRFPLPTLTDTDHHQKLSPHKILLISYAVSDTSPMSMPMKGKVMEIIPSRAALT